MENEKVLSGPVPVRLASGLDRNLWPFLGTPGLYAALKLSHLPGVALMLHAGAMHV